MKQQHSVNLYDTVRSWNGRRSFEVVGRPRPHSSGVDPSRGGPREGVMGLLHGVIGAITPSNRSVTRSNRVSV